MGIFQETARGLIVLQGEQAPFMPQLNMEIAEMQRKVMKLEPSVGFALPAYLDFPPAPVPNRAHGYAVPDSSLVSATIKAPIDDYIPYGRTRRDEIELRRFEASIRRLEHGGRFDCPGMRSLEPGELLDTQRTTQSLKRNRELSPQQSVKRARYGYRTDKVPYQPDLNRIFYGGPDLIRMDSSLQERHDLLRPLGFGGQGTAYLVRSRCTETTLVCKVIPHRRSDRQEQSELRILRDALPAHPRIIGLRSAIVSSLQTELYLDYCSGGDLTSFMEAYESRQQPDRFAIHRRNFIPESFIWHTFLQLTEALAFTHHGYDRNAKSSAQMDPDKWLGVIHRDIKPSNVFLQRAPTHPDHPGPEPYPKVVLGDFGLAKQAEAFNKPPTSDNWMGTFVFQPPELPHHSTKGDVWAVGAIIFLMMTGYLPTQDLPEEIQDPRVVRDLWWRALVNERDYCPPGYGIQGYSKGLTWCLERALTENPRRRATSLQLFLEIEDCRDRMAAGWEELMPWVNEDQR
ncbi:MAG: hypothetical protein Q9226_002767 [Calogaya cf. arnoldii]